MNKKMLDEAIFDKILSTILAGPNKATQLFLKSQIKKDPSLLLKIKKSEELAASLDKSNDEVLSALRDKWAGTEFEKYFQK